MNCDAIEAGMRVTGMQLTGHCVPLSHVFSDIHLVTTHKVRSVSEHTEAVGRVADAKCERLSLDFAMPNVQSLSCVSQQASQRSHQHTDTHIQTHENECWADSAKEHSAY